MGQDGAIEVIGRQVERTAGLDVELPRALLDLGQEFVLAVGLHEGDPVFDEGLGLGEIRRLGSERKHKDESDGTEEIGAHENLEKGATAFSLFRRSLECP